MTTARSEIHNHFFLYEGATAQLSAWGVCRGTVHGGVKSVARDGCG